jgi:hypothetical protein
MLFQLETDFGCNEKKVKNKFTPLEASLSVKHDNAAPRLSWLLY